MPDFERQHVAAMRCLMFSSLTSLFILRLFDFAHARLPARFILSPTPPAYHCSSIRMFLLFAVYADVLLDCRRFYRLLRHASHEASA